MRIAVMQPYFFPYIGYFQLVNLVDKFVFYDDVNFIKNGWINRNRIIINQKASYFTIQLKNASSFKKINEIEFTDKRHKLLKTLEMAYKKAPYYNSVMPMVEDVLKYETNKISNLAIYSVIKTSNYLGFNTDFDISSKSYAETQGLNKAERLIEICNQNKINNYVNAIGGKELYAKDTFKKSNVNLLFIKSKINEYKQFNNEFIPGLSIIDILMFNSIEETNKMLNSYELI